MPWKTKLTKLLSIDYPIIQGGMAYISDGLLAAAMAHAGCAGVIGSGGSPPTKCGTISAGLKIFWDPEESSA